MDSPSTLRVVHAPGWLVIWALALCVASLPFEMPERTFRLEVTTISASLFLAVTLLRPRACYLEWVPTPLWWFGAFYLCAAATPALYGWSLDGWGLTQTLLLILQAMLLFWAAANVLRDRRAVPVVLWAFVVACLVRAALPYLGVGRTAHAVWTGGERLTAFGQNANFSGKMLAAGLLMLLGLTFLAPRATRGRWLALPGLALLGLALVDTGSRGSLAALGAGLLVSAALFAAGGRGGAGAVWAAVRNVVIATLVLGFLVRTALRTDVMRGRLVATAETGTMAGREELFPALGRMFLDRPWLGWGLRYNQYELAARAPYRTREKRDSHNLVLEVLTTTGLAGGVPFLVGLGMCGVAAWRGRRGELGALPVALLAAELVASLAGNPIASKLFWFTLAYCVAAGLRARAAVSAPGRAPPVLAPAPAPAPVPARATAADLPRVWSAVR